MSISNDKQFGIVVSVLIDDSDDVWELYLAKQKDFVKVKEKLETIISNCNIETPLKKEFFKKYNNLNGKLLYSLGVTMEGEKGNKDHPEIINISIIPIKDL